MQTLKRFGWLAVSIILAPFVLNRANSDFDKAPASALVVILLTIVCLGQAVAYSLLRKRYTDLLLQRNGTEPSSLAVNLALDRKSRPSDRECRYTLIKLCAHIDVHGNYCAEYERHGVNQSKKPVDHILVLSCAASPLEFAELDVRAYDLNNGRAPLRVRPLEDIVHQKVFEISFKTPVHQNEQFAVGWSMTWPRVMRAAGDYDFLVLKDFERGVEMISYTLKFDRELSSYRFEALEKDGSWRTVKETRYQGQPTANDFSYALEIRNPECECYKFSYTT